MHEANEGGSAEKSQDSSKRVRILNDNPTQGRQTTDTSETSVVLDKGHPNQRSGDMPISVGVREDSDNAEMEYSSEEASSEDQEIDSTASDAAPAAMSPGMVR